MPHYIWHILTLYIEWLWPSFPGFQKQWPLYYSWNIEKLTVPQSLCTWLLSSWNALSTNGPLSHLLSLYRRDHPWPLNIKTEASTTTTNIPLTLFFFYLLYSFIFLQNPNSFLLTVFSVRLIMTEILFVHHSFTSVWKKHLANSRCWKIISFE